jgi:hypothetical protein
VKLAIQIILDQRNVTGNNAKTNVRITDTKASEGIFHQNIFKVYNILINAV